MPDIERQLADAEEAVAREVAAVFDELAAEIAEQLAQATEIVAARFSLSRIGRAWTARLPRIVRRLLGVAETAADQAADDANTPLPDGWDDLPGRHERGEPLPASLGTYVEATEHLLRAVGDRLTEAAVAELAVGLDAGEDTEQLRARLRAMFSRDGAQLGTVREERIARTEAARAWNAATLAAAEDVTDPDRPLVKQWTTRRDARVRDTHDAADGQIRLLDETFTVGGVPMRYPGDPTAPASLTVNCRCILRLAPERQAAAYEPQDSTRPDVYESKEVTAAGGHTGAMIALVPAQADAERLAVDGGEPVDELHCTLLFLGDAADWDTDQRQRLIDALRTSVDADLPEPVHALAFGVNQWNPASDDPAWVYAVGDDPDHGSPDLRLAHLVARDAIARTDGLPEILRQHSPWVAHTTAAYAPDTWPLDAMNERLGPVTYDRLRIAFAGDTTDIPLGSDEEAPPVETTAAAIDEPPILTWSTPDDTGLAFENTQTGDGRVFASGALFWEGPGPWPLQYADEMIGGHEGAELAGAINEYGRDGDRITGSGVLYLTQRAGAEAAMLLAQGAPLGVSVDLDSVDIELVDTTATAEDADDLVLAASFASASVLRLPDGAGWIITARSRAEWTASAGGVMSRTGATTQVISGPGGRISTEAAQALFPGVVTAAAGDRDDPDGGIVVHSEQAGDYLVRITRGRVRGATLVSMPAFDQARIVLDDIEPEEPTDEVAAAGSDFERVIAHVCGAPVPVAAREIAQALGLPIAAVRRHLARAAEKGRLVRISRGLYTGPSSIPADEATASSTASSAALGELEASAWQVMQQQPPMPAAWFREPTIEELPPNSGGVHYKDGRVYGWVAQAGVPHEVHGRKVMIDKLGKIDTSYFLRAKFPLDDGSEVAVGTITMNVGHHRDGFECETAACQFDDSRTVAGIVTVGMNRRGMWFSGAAAPWLSDWDLNVFRSLQPSYHMTQGPGGTWQLKAVLSVPVPAHPSRLAAAAHLAATAVVERSNLALTAAAAAVPDSPPSPPTPAPPAPAEPEPAAEPESQPARVDDLTASLLSPDFLDRFSDALVRREAERAAQTRAEIEQLAALVDGAAA